MTKQVVVAALCLALTTPAFAQQDGPIARTAATQQPAAQPIPKTRMKNSGMYVGGLVLSGVGGFMLGRGIVMEKGAVCAGGFGIVACEEVGSSKNLLILGGAALAGTGILLVALGGKRVSVSPSLSGVTVRFNVLK